MILKQVRDCDGACCREKPRFPENGSCRFLDDKGRCKIKEGKEEVPEGESPVWPGRSASDVYQETCVEWPQNSLEGSDTGGCCWQWVDGD